jgi:hypothetical protein
MLVDPTILRKMFPYLNYLAVGLGIAKLIVYYRAFGIDIVQYLELSEVLILFFNDILMFFVFLAIISIFAIFGGHSVADEQREVIENVLTHQNKWRRFLEYLKGNYAFVLFVLAVSGSQTNRYFIVALVVHYFAYELNFVLRKRYNTELSATYFNVGWFVLIFVLMGFRRLETEIRLAKEGGRYNGTTLQLSKEESITTTDSTIAYIGKTKDYYYLYDKKKGNAVIIPSDKVERVDLKNKYYWFWQYPR